MSHWNYRVIEFVDPETGPWRAIHEVHYDDDGKLRGYCEDPASVISETNDGLGDVLNMMRSALSKDVLVERDFEPLPEQNRSEE